MTVALPPFINGAVEPLLDLFSYVGIPVRKRKFNEFGERIITDYDDDFDERQPRQWHESDLYEIQAQVQQIHVPRAKMTLNPSYQTVSKFVPFNNDERIGLDDDMPVSELNCGPEIPILLINMNNNRSFIMSTPNQNSDISIYSYYRKVSEMDLGIFNGMGPYTLDTFLKAISEGKETGPMIKFIDRPKGILTEGGKFNINSEPSGIPFYESAMNNNDDKICSQCPEYIKMRPHFPNLSIIEE